jgi:hypothetical protein
LHQPSAIIHQPSEGNPKAIFLPKDKNSRNMKFLKFDDIKAQLRLDDQQAEDERNIIELHAKAAEDAVLNVCHRTLTEVFETYGEIPAGLTYAALLLTDDAYNHRGTISPQAVYHLPTFDLNVKPYVKLTI